MKSKVGTRGKPENDKYYMIHQRKPIIISAEEVERLKRQGGGKLTTFEELIAKDEDRRERHRIANRKNAKKRYANNKEMQEMAREVEKYKNILSQEEARAEAERRAEESDEEGFDILLNEEELKPLCDILKCITQSNNPRICEKYLSRFIKKNKLKNICDYEDVEHQFQQMNTIINKLKLLL